MDLKARFKRFVSNLMPDSNKGQAAGVFTGLLAAAITFTVLILATSLVSGVVSDVRGGQTVDTASYNVSTRGLNGMLNLSGQYGNMGTVLAVVGIISLLLGAFAVFQRGRQ